MARISVLIPTYQHGAFIGECISSVLAQRTTHHLEILIGEDGSTDNTLAVCEEFARQDARIQVIRQPAAKKVRIEGVLTGRYNCLDLIGRATGDYLCLLEGDDGWLGTEKLQAQVEALERDSSLAGSYHRTLVREGTAPPGAPWIKEMPARMTVHDTIRPLAPFHTGSFLWRNSEALRALLSDKLAWEAGSFDMYLFVCVAAQGDLIAVPGDLSFYRKHDGGLTATALLTTGNLPRLRVVQWLRSMNVLDAALHDHLRALCDHHLHHLGTQPLSFQNRRRWLLALLSFPTYFLRAPWRARKVLSAVRHAASAR